MFKCLGTNPAEMAMSAGSIVEHLDVVEHVCLGEISGLVDTLFDALLFQTTKEGLDNGVDAQQFPRRLMLGSRLCALQKRNQSSLLYWDP